MIGDKGSGGRGGKKTEELNAETLRAQRTEIGNGDDMTFI
jgi:hypothetical protein